VCGNRKIERIDLLDGRQFVKSSENSDQEEYRDLES